ncbi:MAG: DUF4162 domain-containing protein, partial [Patescibacteria group bacterium]|nr:DUF4162 domain-containing protein [Patescibacteria group bacterium]
ELSVRFEGDPSNIEAFLKERHITGTFKDHTLHITAESEEIPNILGKLYANGYKIRDINIDEPNLEDVFLKIAREGITA